MNFALDLLLVIVAALLPMIEVVVVIPAMKNPKGVVVILVMRNVKNDMVRGHHRSLVMSDPVLQWLRKKLPVLHRLRRDPVMVLVIVGK